MKDDGGTMEGRGVDEGGMREGRGRGEGGTREGMRERIGKE